MTRDHQILSVIGEKQGRIHGNPVGWAGAVMRKPVAILKIFRTDRPTDRALRDPLGRVGRSFGTAGLDTGSRGLGTGRGSTGARYSASVLGNDTKNLGNKNILNILFKRLLKMKKKKQTT